MVEPCTLHTDLREQVKRAIGQLKSGELLTEKAAHRLKISEDYVKILLLLVEEKYDGWNPADIMAEAMALARRVQREYQTEQKVILTEAIAAAEARGANKEAAELLEKYQHLLKE